MHMALWRRRAAAILLLGSLVLVTGCESVNVPVRASSGGNDLLASAHGRLEIRGGCLTIVSDGEAWAIAWPHGTIWNPVTQSISFGGFQATVGDEVQLAGGERENSGAIDPEDWSSPPTDACMAFDKIWWVAQFMSL